MPYVFQINSLHYIRTYCIPVTLCISVTLTISNKYLIFLCQLDNQLLVNVHTVYQLRTLPFCLLCQRTLVARPTDDTIKPRLLRCPLFLNRSCQGWPNMVNATNCLPATRKGFICSVFERLGICFKARHTQHVCKTNKLGALLHVFEAPKFVSRILTRIP